MHYTNLIPVRETKLEKKIKENIKQLYKFDDDTKFTIMPFFQQIPQDYLLFLHTLKNINNQLEIQNLYDELYDMKYPIIENTYYTDTNEINEIDDIDDIDEEYIYVIND